MLYQMRLLQKLGNLRVVLVAAILYVPLSLAQPPKGAVMFDRGARKMMRSQDVAFALNAAQVLAGQNQLAELALKHAAEPAVKQFASRLLAENRKIGSDLRAAAAKSSLVLPDNATEQNIAQKANLLRRSGSAFDAAFAGDLVTCTRQDLSSYEKESRKGKDLAVQGFAARTLSVLRARYAASKELKAAMKNTGA